MNSKATYTLVGIFVLVLGAALIGGILWLGSGQAGKDYDSYVVYMSESVSGLSKDAAVKYRGVNVGHVRSITLDPDNPQRVRLLLGIREGTPIKTDTVATLETQGLTGLANINLTGGSRDAPPLKAAPGQRYPVIKSRPSLLGRLDRTLSKLLENLTETSNRMNDLLGSDNRKLVATSLKNLNVITTTLAAQSKTLTRSLADFAGTMRNARTASRQLPDLLSDISNAANSLQTMASSVATASTSVRKAVDATSNNVGQIAADTIPQAHALLDELRQTSENVRQLTEELKRDPSMLLYGAPSAPPGPGE